MLRASSTSKQWERFPKRELRAAPGHHGKWKSSTAAFAVAAEVSNHQIGQAPQTFIERPQPVVAFAGDLSQQLCVGANGRPRKLHLLLQVEAILLVLSQHCLVFCQPAFMALDRIIFAIHSSLPIAFSSRAAGFLGYRLLSSVGVAAFSPE